jgi:DNA-binding MarR family transcriptional regulator
MPAAAPETPTVEAFDPLVVNPGRLSILVALSGRGAASSGVEFVDLRRQTRLTDGNLNCHARRLASGGLIEIAKQFRDDKPVTTYLLTAAGEQALRSHVETLVGKTGVTTPPHRQPIAAAATEEDWVD